MGGWKAINQGSEWVVSRDRRCVMEFEGLREDEARVIASALNVLKKESPECSEDEHPRQTVTHQ